MSHHLASVSLGRAGLFLAITVFAPVAIQATPIVEAFESFADSQSLTVEIPNLTFSNATILSAGVSLNEFEFPPHSGVNVVFDDGGPISIEFVAAVNAVSGYFTYATRVTMTIYSTSMTLLGTTTSSFGSNLALSGEAGSSPNEVLQFMGSGIGRVVLSGDAAGSSFVLDDLSWETSDAVAVPEPSLAYPMAVASLFAVLGRAGATWGRRPR